MHDERREDGNERRGPDDSRQQQLDFVRAEQLRILRDAELPKQAKDAAGKGVKANVLKSVLSAIDHFGRGRSGGAYAAVATLASSANIGPRTATRAIEVLQSLGLVCVTNDGCRAGMRGSPTNRYTIVWSELALLVDRSALARGAISSSRAAHAGRPADQSATDVFFARDQSATGADQSATGADQSATGADQSATGGAQNARQTPRSAREAPSDVRRGVGDGGARYFFEDEVAAVRARANEINAQAQARTLADRELVLKLATLTEDGEVHEDVICQVLESYQRAAERGERINNRMAWLWSAVKNQCWRRNLRLEQLLATTDFPRELLPVPAERAAHSSSVS